MYSNQKEMDKIREPGSKKSTVLDSFFEKADPMKHLDEEEIKRRKEKKEKAEEEKKEKKKNLAGRDEEEVEKERKLKLLKKLKLERAKHEQRKIGFERQMTEKQKSPEMQECVDTIKAFVRGGLCGMDRLRLVSANIFRHYGVTTVVDQEYAFVKAGLELVFDSSSEGDAMVGLKRCRGPGNKMKVVSKRTHAAFKVPDEECF